MRLWLTIILSTTLIGGCSFARRTEIQDVSAPTYEEKIQVPMMVAVAPPATAEHPQVTPSLTGTGIPTPARAPVMSAPPGPPTSQPTVAYATQTRTFRGQGIHAFNEMFGVRVVSPFGVSPGEVVTEAAKKPMTIAAGDTPAISIGRDGTFKVSKGDEARVVGSETAGGSIQRAWDAIWNWGAVILIIIAVLLILPIIFPVLKPVFTVIWNTLVTVWNWIKAQLAHLFSHVLVATTPTPASTTATTTSSTEALTPSASKEPNA